MEQFKTNENKALLWDLISENITLDNNGKHHIYNLFNQNYNPFYQNQFNTCNSLMELNKKYIMFIRSNINEYDHKSKLVTHEDIQKNKVNQFDIEYQNQKNDFDSSINIKPPPVPDFKIKMEDEPLKETDKLIQEMIKSRNYEIDKVYQKNDIVTKNTNKLDTPSLDTPSLDTPSLDTRNLKNSNNNIKRFCAKCSPGVADRRDPNTRKSVTVMKMGRTTDSRRGSSPSRLILNTNPGKIY